MAFADSNRVSLRYIIENPAIWGTTPASGVVREIRLTSSSLAASKETVTSDELRADRMVSSVVEVSAMSGGDINFEYSAGSQDDFLQQFVLGAWTRPMGFDQWRGEQLAWINATTFQITGVDATDYFTADRRIKTEGFANLNNNGYFEIASVSLVGADTQIVIDAAVPAPQAEAGTFDARLFDANDVIVLNSTGISAVAATNTLAGTGIFASARAAGQLVAHQKIFVNGLGYAAGSFLFDEVAEDGLSLRVDDGVNAPVDFVFDATPTGEQLALGADADASAANLRTAIRAKATAGLLNVKVGGAAATVALTNFNNVTGALTENADAGGNVTTTTFAGGSPTARGFFTILSVTDDAIVVKEDITADAAAGAPVTIKGSMLRNPGNVAAIVAQSMSIATSFNDVDKHLLQDGLRNGSFSLDVSSGSIVTGTISMQGRATTSNAATPFLEGGSYTNLQAPATEVMNATTNVGNLSKDGAALATALQSIAIEGDASLRNQMAVGSKFPRGIGTGRFSLTGTIQAYFENFDLYDNFIAHDTVSLGFSFTDIDTNTYFWTLPAIKITSDPVAPGGIDQDVMEALEFTAFRDQASACMLQVDRFSSVVAV